MCNYPHGSDGLLSIFAVAGVHIKSITVKEVSIRKSFSTSTGN